MKSSNAMIEVKGGSHHSQMVRHQTETQWIVVLMMKRVQSEHYTSCHFIFFEVEFQ